MISLLNTDPDQPSQTPIYTEICDTEICDTRPLQPSISGLRKKRTKQPALLPLRLDLPRRVAEIAKRLGHGASRARHVVNIVVLNIFSGPKIKDQSSKTAKCG